MPPLRFGMLCCALQAREILDMLDKMVGQKYPIPEPCDITPEGRDLLVRMLLPDPQQVGGKGRRAGLEGPSKKGAWPRGLAWGMEGGVEAWRGKRLERAIVLGRRRGRVVGSRPC